MSMWERHDIGNEVDGFIAMVLLCAYSFIPAGIRGSW